MDLIMQIAPYQMVEAQVNSKEIPTGVGLIKAEEFWNKGYKGKGVKVAIIDSGCQSNHPDLKDRIIGGRNFTPEDGGDPSKFKDYNGHGTHVAGTIGVSANNVGVVCAAANSGDGNALT